MRIRFVVVGKPVPQARARICRMRNGQVRMYTPEASEKYQDAVRRTALHAGCPLFAPGCEVWLFIYLPDRRRRDRDNILKAVLDALQPRRSFKTKPARRAIAWKDDHDIGRVTQDWRVDCERPRVEVTIDGDVVERFGR